MKKARVPSTLLRTKKSVLGSAVCAVLFALSFSASAQQSKKIPRLGLLLNNPAPAEGRQAAFRQGLRDLGWIEGRNIIIEYRFAKGKSDRFPELAAELVRLGVDLIFAIGAPAAEAAKRATSSIPVVVSMGDPVAAGLVASLAHPGGNITGVANFTPVLVGKRLELFKEALPQISRVAILWNPDSPAGMSEVESAANLLGVKVRPVEAKSGDDLEYAFTLIRKEQLGGLFPLRSPLIINQLK